MKRSPQWEEGNASGAPRETHEELFFSATIFPIKAADMQQPERAEGVPTTMFLNKPKLRLIGAFAVLGALALAASCRGFFVKPTLSSIAVGPASPSIQTGSTNNTVQMFVVGTFNDGSTGNPTVSWSISPNQGVATISPSGLVTSVGTGSATVTATASQNPSISGTQSLTVIVGCITSITLNPTSGSITNGGTTSVSIKATAQTCNGSEDITSVATWKSSNTQIATVSAGVVTPTGTAGMNGTVAITATAGGITSSPASITVSGY